MVAPCFSLPIGKTLGVDSSPPSGDKLKRQIHRTIDEDDEDDYYPRTLALPIAFLSGGPAAESLCSQTPPQLTPSIPEFTRNLVDETILRRKKKLW